MILRKRFPIRFSAALLSIILILAATRFSLCWSNGGYSSDPSSPKYGTHDWIAEHALDWLPSEVKGWILANKNLYLYGTELPDNNRAPDGIGDTWLHHIYFDADGRLIDDSSARRANATYQQALSYMLMGDFSLAAKYAGAMTHYLSDAAVFAHVMGEKTPWGKEKHHDEYERYVNDKTSSYQSEFNGYLKFDGALEIITAYDAAVRLAYDTTFDASGRNLTCVWMDENYNWSNPTFWDRVGEPLNYAVNLITDVLYTLYTEYMLSQQAPETAVVTFTASGLEEDTEGVVLIIDGVSYSCKELPLKFTWDAGSWHNYSWAAIVESTIEGKRYVWLSSTGLSSSREGLIAVPEGEGEISATFRRQFLWIFKAEGLDADVAWTVRGVAAIAPEERIGYEVLRYSDSEILAAYWWDDGSKYRVAYEEIVESTIEGKRYVCREPPRLNITVTGPGTIVASYDVEFAVYVSAENIGKGTTNPPPGEYWVVRGSKFTVEAIPNAGYVFYEWRDTATSRDNPLTVEVNAPFSLQATFIETFDFNVSAAPSTAKTTKGMSYTFSVNVERVKGISERVSLSTSGLPQGVTASFNVVSEIPPFLSVLTITASKDAPAGTYMIAIEAKSGNLTRTAYISLTIEEPEQPWFNLILSAAIILVAVAVIAVFFKRRRR